MIISETGKHRPFHYGKFPFETLDRKLSVGMDEAARPRGTAPPADVPDNGVELVRAVQKYTDLFVTCRTAEVAPARAPIPADLRRRTMDIKGNALFLDAAHVGICRIPEQAWYQGREIPSHQFAVVIAIEKCRIPEPDNLAQAWVAGARDSIAVSRATGIAANIANYIGALGFSATAHAAAVTDVDIARLSVMAGITCRFGESVVSPFLEDNIVLAAITTAYALAIDLPLSPVRHAGKSLRYWWGINGAESGRERNRRNKRPTHMSAYPMEQVRRVDRPTTLIIDDEVPRVPKRASFFDRALSGDLGARTRKERLRFAYKHPSAYGYLRMIQGMAPIQDGEINAAADVSGYTDAAANSRAIKSLSYALGADLTGICEIPRYAWYSHVGEGKPVKPYHKYAVVMLIDQGYETMEGASGDDWISGSQSMRAYMRGAEVAGIMAEFLRGIGYSARPQTNVDSHVLHIPLILWAGLGELSRIGELVLNPFVGPRFKSVVMTTNLPLAVDKPVDFGLQYFCNHCLKCARECPCDAIPVTHTVMFNGYEMWKIDAERCARYRLTNARGAACGRCMKTCPLNKVPTADGPLLHRIGSWLGVNAMWLKPLLVPIAVYLDDRLGYGRRNPAKQWWLDLEMIDGVAVTPAAGANQREIDYQRKLNTGREKIAYYHASMMPPPDQKDPYPVDRKAAKAAAVLLETPQQARERLAAGGARPLHYIPTQPLDPANNILD
jgi:reductive dehalogenase